MKPAPVYWDEVLKENLQTARRLFFQPLMEIHGAHLLMLRKTSILSVEDARALARGLALITEESLDLEEDPNRFEDLFYLVEALLTRECGEATSGKLHIARSRNDIAVTLYRLRWREAALTLGEKLLSLRSILLNLAEKHAATVLTIHTHTQPAQPSTLGHYLLGVHECLERDQERLSRAFESLNRCPMGACALAGTGFPIDRRMVSDLLGFEGPTENTHASVVGVDYLLEFMAALMVFLTTLGKVIQDLLTWGMPELGFLSLADGYVQASSIMPQKRNPVALEHSRALAGKALGQAAGVFLMIHNTPYGDISDVEDDLQPLVEAVVRDSSRVLTLLGPTLREARFDVDRMLQHARGNWITVTELADCLVRRERLSFRQAHEVTSKLVRLGETAEPLSQRLATVSAEVLGRALRWDEGELQEILSPEYFVSVRATWGGPASDELHRSLRASLERARREADSIESRRSRLEAYPIHLAEELRLLAAQ